MTTAKEAAQDLAPNGLLRVAINTGNPVLVQRRDRAGEPTGPSVDIAREIARRLNVEILFVVYDAAGKVVEAVDHDEWALGFLAIDPLRGKNCLFTTLCCH